MTCPYCHVEYTEERPCFCQPSSRQVEQSKLKDFEVTLTHAPTGLNNPFWPSRSLDDGRF